MEKRQFDDLVVHDLSNEEIWQGIDSMLQLTLEMLQEIAEERSIDLNAIAMEADPDAEQHLEATTRDHKCARAVEGYADVEP